jgi:hypothetical protein
VHDPRGVRLGDGLARLQDECYGLDKRQRPVAHEHLGQVVSLQKLHDHIRSAGLELSNVEHASDVLAFQPHSGSGLAQESLDCLRVAEGLIADKLDGYELPEFLMARGDHYAHSSDAEDTLDSVFAGEEIPLPDGNQARLDH